MLYISVVVQDRHIYNERLCMLAIAWCHMEVTCDQSRPIYLELVEAYWRLSTISKIANFIQKKI